MHKITRVVLRASEVMDTLCGADMNSFYAKFVKRTDGTVRNILFKLPGVDKSSGVAVPIKRILEDDSRQLITVWDVNKDSYRRLNLRDVKSLVVDNKEIEIDCAR